MVAAFSRLFDILPGRGGRGSNGTWPGVSYLVPRLSPMPSGHIPYLCILDTHHRGWRTWRCPGRSPRKRRMDVLVRQPPARSENRDMPRIPPPGHGDISWCSMDLGAVDKENQSLFICLAYLYKVNYTLVYGEKERDSNRKTSRFW